jgi:predicted nucleotidyltransferase
MPFAIDVSKEKIEAFCRRNQIREFSFFGSVLTDSFTSHSDLDVLVSFHPDLELSLVDLGRMREELKEIFGREVDLVEKEALHNPYRKYSILREKQTIYAA